MDTLNLKDEKQERHSLMMDQAKTFYKHETHAVNMFALI